MQKIKENMVKELELLAPARDYETGRVAVLAGADAVYIGAPKFGARAAAGNNWEDVAQLCSFAHLYRVKVYIALNTIIFDQELEEARQAAWRAYEVGADALIIQDLAFLEMDRPPLPLFASTQMDNQKDSQVRFWEESGFSRVILARELSLEQIRRIREKTNVDLECFVHGALCVSYSGRCYLSQYLAGRSANRGECVQACRFPYTLIDGEGKELARDKYLLSLKDLNLSDNLSDLIEAGVSSFKIEGRLKDAAYVANIVAYYRRRLDDIIAERKDLKSSSSGLSSFVFQSNPAKSFNRGFCQYFLSGKRGEWISPYTQKSLGEEIGAIAKIQNGAFSLACPHDLKNGDGICFFGRDSKLYGALINRVDAKGVISLHKQLPLFPGAVIYRNQDAQFDQAAVAGVSRQIRVEISVSFRAGKKMIIAAGDEDGYREEIEVGKDFVQAENQLAARENMAKQLRKAGGTPFLVEKVLLDDGDEFPHIPLSQLNAWRRELLSRLANQRQQGYCRKLREGKMGKVRYPSEQLGYEHNVANGLARQFYLSRGVKDIEPALEVSREYRGRKLMTTKHCLKYYLGACPKQGGKRHLQEPLRLINGNNKLKLRFDCAACNMEIYEDN